MLKLLIFPFFVVQVAVEMTAGRLADATRAKLKTAVQELVADTLTDAEEVNQLRAEIALLRSEVNEIKYGGKISTITVL